MKIMRFALCLVAILAILLTAGCDSKEENKAAPSTNTATSTEQSTAPSSQPTVPKTVQPQEIEVKVYYPNNQGTKLTASTRKVKVDDKQDKYTAAIRALMQGAKDKGQSTIIPKQARLNGVTIKDATATVDFSREIVKNFVGGSTGEEMMVGSIVNTLTQFPEVTQVKILVGGEPVETIAGHMDLSLPLERMQQLIP
ncbi:MAG: GerMN domain-containing protein [Selenomonadaceae bacterium]|nr:GerMN domain-containing protein [Selenomonadaceae bacterium]